MNSPDSGVPRRPGLTLSSGLRGAAARDPDKIALVHGPERRTYAELIGNVNRTAKIAREALGLQPGQHAALVAPNCIEYLEIVAALSDVGVPVATPSPKLAPAELADVCTDAEARVLFVHPSCEDAIDRTHLPTVERVVRLGDELENLRARASDCFEPKGLSEYSTFAIPYTSGTTGRPKGVMLSHRSRTLAFLWYAAEYGIYSPDDRFLALAPMCHGAGFAFAYAALFVGGTTEIATRFEPDEVLATLHAGEVTGMFTVPTHLHAMLSVGEAAREACRGHRLKGIVCNAAPLSEDLKHRAVDYFGPGLLHELYGSTEAGVVTSLRPRDLTRKIRCVGTPAFGCEVRLLDDAGREVAAGEVGELYSRSPMQFNGYWRKPEATRDCFRGDWLSVGDLARRDDEGYVYIVDRKKDMVITGGLNVYPREVEAVLDTCDGVLESAVVGVPDAHWGERLVAVVVPRRAGAIDAALLAAFCDARLAAFKRPREFVAVDALPRNANGKVLKTQLRAQLVARHEERLNG